MKNLSLLDFVLALFFLFLLFPVFVILAILIKWDSHGPVFFIQPRVGKDGRVFQLYKFRSLYVEADPQEAVLKEGDLRITRMGKIMRPTGLDEIPQFLNILLGQMTFIGPRPTLPNQVMQYTEFQKKRHTVKPGLTGLAAVCGGHELTWKQRIRFDVWYSRHKTLALDLWIVCQTFLILLRGRKLYSHAGLSEVSL